MSERTCVVCDTGLTGRQAKYCGQRCKGVADAEAERRRPGHRARRRQYQQAWLDRAGLKSSSYSPTKRCVGCGCAGVRYDAEFCTRSCAERHKPQRPATPTTCIGCGIEFVGTRKTCSDTCLKATTDRLKSPLTLAWEASDWPAVVAEMLLRTEPAGDCRVWLGQARSRRGAAYGHVKIGRSQLSAHRVVARAVFGELGHMPVHHKCANGLCINPDHLQVVTPHENTAEMLERHSYIRRIAELESALAAVDPLHPALP